jgi:hypothetical protein
MNIQFRETKALWEGTLEQPAVAFTRGADEISASIGEPFQWADGEMLGGNWKPPLVQCCYLVQLGSTHPRNKSDPADFCLTLAKGEARWF